jgi:hypothetical protein
MSKACCYHEEFIDWTAGEPRPANNGEIIVQNPEFEKIQCWRLVIQWCSTFVRRSMNGNDKFLLKCNRIWDHNYTV